MTAAGVCPRCGTGRAAALSAVEQMVRATCQAPYPADDRPALVAALRLDGDDIAADWYVGWDHGARGESAQAVEALSALRDRTATPGLEYWHLMSLATLAYHPDVFGPSEGALLLVHAIEVLEGLELPCSLAWLAQNQIAIGWAMQSMTDQALTWFEKALQTSDCRPEVGARGAAESNLVHLDLEAAVEAVAVDDVEGAREILEAASRRADGLGDNHQVLHCPAWRLLRRTSDDAPALKVERCAVEDIVPLAAIAYLQDRVDAGDVVDAAWARRAVLSATHRIALARLRYAQAMRERPHDATRLQAQLMAQIDVGMRSFRRQRVDAVAGLHQAQRERQLLRETADTDELTGLMNRRGFTDRMRREIALVDVITPTLAVLVLDLDGFKRVNDKFGHPAGDEALRAVGRLLGDGLRTHDVIARWGGDEFAVIAPRIRRRTDCDALLSRLEAAVRDGVAETDERFDGLSICGGAGWYEPGDDVTSLFARADSALIARKAARRCTEETDSPLGSTAPVT